jgi:hypothetical protein
MISLFEITRLKNSFEYQTWQIEMRNQLIFMNLWHYVEIDEFSNSTILIVEISVEKNFSVFVVSSTSEKVRKFRIDNLKTVTIIRNRLKCNDRNLLKNEINVIKTWQILKKSFSSCESKVLNDLLIKLWIIILITSRNDRFRTEPIDSVLTFGTKLNRTESSGTKPLKFRFDSTRFGFSPVRNHQKEYEKLLISSSRREVNIYIYICMSCTQHARAMKKNFFCGNYRAES